jgi:hypothetical protein
MIFIANPEPITLSVVEGCAQSPRSNIIEIGMVEGWNDGWIRLKPKIPIFPYSNTPFPSYASEIFLSSLQTEFFNNLLDGRNSAEDGRSGSFLTSDLRAARV